MAARRNLSPAEGTAGFTAKALSSLQAADSLCAQRPDSSASRAYYAVHNAMQARCAGGPPLPRDHGLLASSEVLARVGLSPAHARDVEVLRAYRHMGDYEPARVNPEKALECLRMAKVLLSIMGIEVS